MSEPVNGILEFIKKMDSERGQALEREIAGMDADQQFDRVMQALDTVKLPEARTAEAPTLLPEDRKLVDECRAAMDRFWSQEAARKS